MNTAFLRGGFLGVLLASLSQCAPATAEAPLIAAVQHAASAGADAVKAIRHCCTRGYAEAHTLERVRELDHLCLPLADAYEALRDAHAIAVQTLRQAEMADELAIYGHTLALRHATAVTLRAAQPYHRGCR